MAANINKQNQTGLYTPKGRRGPIIYTYNIKLENKRIGSH